MTIPRLEGIGDVVQQDLPQVADAIHDVVDPNWKFNQAMKMLFLQKPELMQKFVDIEHANPGTLKAFGFNERGTDLLSGMQESFPALRERTVRPQAEAALRNPATARAVGTEIATGHTPGENAGDALKELLDSGGLAILNGPNGVHDFQEALRHRLGLQTPLEEQMQGLSAEALAASEKPVTLTGTDGRPVTKKLGDLGLPEILGALRNGQLDNATVTGGLENPKTKGLLAAALRQMEAENHLRMSSFYGVQDDIERTKISRALQMFDASGQVGSADAWYQLANPGQHMPGSNHVVTPLELKQVQEASRNEQVQRRIGQLNDANKALDQLMNKDWATQKTPEGRQGVVDRINEQLAVSDPTKMAVIDDPFIGAPRIKFVLRTDGTTPTDPPVLGAPVTPVANTVDENSLSPAAKTALTRWRALRQQKPQGYQNTISTELNRIKAANPVLGTTLEQALGTE